MNRSLYVVCASESANRLKFVALCTNLPLHYMWCFATVACKAGYRLQLATIDYNRFSAVGCQCYIVPKLLTLCPLVTITAIQFLQRFLEVTRKEVLTNSVDWILRGNLTAIPNSNRLLWEVSQLITYILSFWYECDSIVVVVVVVVITLNMLHKFCPFCVTKMGSVKTVPDSAIWSPLFSISGA
jgi:hypothetical protein